MGLFRRKKSDPSERDALLAEIEALRRRLDESDLQKDRLHAKLHVVAERNMAIDEQVHTLNEARTEIDERIASLDEARAALDDRVGMVTSSSADLQERVAHIGNLTCKVQELSERLTIPKPTEPPPPPPVRVDPRVDAISARLNNLEVKAELIDELNTAVAGLAETPADAGDDPVVTALAHRVEDLTTALAAQRTDLMAAHESIADIEPMRAEMAQMAERMGALDSRMRSISLELTNQLTELSNDLQMLLDRPGDEETGPKIDPHQLQLALTEQVDEQVGKALGAIQLSTERLAAEQARYEIKFREDLAELAERLRRPVLH